MNYLRKVLYVLTAAMLGAFSLPNSAATPDKLFSINNPTATNPAVPAPVPAAMPANATTAVTVTVGNESPKSGNSYINSLIITLNLPPSSGATLGTPTLQSGNVVNCPSSTANGALNLGLSNICVANIVGIKPGGSFTMSIPVSVSSNFVCTSALWLGQAFAGNSFSGNAFVDATTGATYSQAPAYPGCDGILGCGDSFSKPATSNNAPNELPGYVFGSRGSTNKDGVTVATGCAAVPYSLTNTLLGTDQTKVYLKWSNQMTAGFKYTVNWAPIPAVDGWTQFQPVVAWPPHTDLSGNPRYVPALACLSPNLPASYGSFVSIADNGDGTWSLTVNVTSASLPTGQFPILITTNGATERMQVLTTVGNSWKVTRQQAGTSAITHLLNDPVVSTPLPIIPTMGPTATTYTSQGYAVGTPAQMCISDQEWLPAGLDSSGTLLIRYFTTVMDIGDGWVGLP